MGKHRYLLQRIADAADLNSEPLPAMPLVEIYGNGRVLIENHMGVLMYSTDEIQIRVKFGHLSITGCALTLAYMSKDRLVITGLIQSVQMYKRG